MTYEDELINALVLEVIATGLSESTWFGPEAGQKIIEEYIEATGGYDSWVERYLETGG